MIEENILITPLISSDLKQNTIKRKKTLTNREKSELKRISFVYYHHAKLQGNFPHSHLPARDADGTAFRT